MSWLLAALLAGCSADVTASDSAISATATHAQPPSVDRRAFAHTATPRAAGTTTAEYFGGPVTANAKVYVVWWGDPSKINSAVTAAKGGIADFYAGVTNSNFIDWLNEYSTAIAAQAGSHKGSAGTNQYIGRGNYVAAITLANVPAGNVTDAQIQSALDGGIADGTLPAPDDNTLYAVYFPPGVTITLDGSTSCSGFGAYHDAIIETQRHDTYYLVMPDCGSSFKSMTSTSSHELIEAITDNIPTPADMPDYPQAWNDSMGNEMADLCEGTSGTVTTDFGSFTVQGIWDERTKGCLTFSSDANDFNVAISPNTATLELNTPKTFTVKTAVAAGSAESLTLSVTAPTGVTATLSPTTITAGATAALTVTATSAPASSPLQVVVRADATSGSTVQTHTAAQLVTIDATAADLGPPPPDLAPAEADLAQPGGAVTPGDDLGTGTGGNGTPASPAQGCHCAIGAPSGGLDGTWPEATLLLLAFVALLWRRRRA